MAQIETAGVHVTPQADFFVIEEDEALGAGVEMTAECSGGVGFHAWLGRKSATAHENPLGLQVTPQEEFFTEHEPLWFGEPGAECPYGMLN